MEKIRKQNTKKKEKEIVFLMLNSNRIDFKRRSFLFLFLFLFLSITKISYTYSIRCLSGIYCKDHFLCWSTLLRSPELERGVMLGVFP